MILMDSNQIIDRLGGTTKVAQLCEVTKASVSQWRNDGIPKARLMFLRLARPDVFGEHATAAVDHENSQKTEVA